MKQNFILMSFKWLKKLEKEKIFIKPKGKSRKVRLNLLGDPNITHNKGYIFHGNQLIGVVNLKGFLDDSASSD